MRKIFITILFFLLVFFPITNYTHASMSEVDGASIDSIDGNDISIERNDGEITIAFTGRLKKAGATSLNSSSSATLMVRWQRIDDTFSSNTLTANFALTADFNENECTLNGPAVEGQTFSCKIKSGLTDDEISYGTYFFQLLSEVRGATGLLKGDGDFLTTARSFDIKKGTVIYKTGLNIIGEPTVTIANNILKVSGKINREGAEDGSLMLHYNKIKTKRPAGSNRSFSYANLTNGSSSTTGGVTSIQAKLEKLNDGTATFTVESNEIKESGDYVFVLGTLRGSASIALYNHWASDFIEFTISDPAITTVQLNSPVTPDESDPANPKVSIRIFVGNTTDDGDGFIQLGHVEQISGTSNGSCILDPELISGRIPIKKGSSPMYFEGLFSGSSKLTPGIYCVAAKAGSMEKFTTFAGKNDIFKIGNVTIPDTLTIDPNANQNGCVIPEGEDGSTTGYCLLAPLPGVGDETGYVDTRTGIEKYINSIIRLVLGLIGVLSVFMVVVGGIEYMSTVNIGEKEGAKHRITQALLGLAVAIGSYAILNTINPDLVNITIHIPGVSIDGATTAGGEEDEEDVGVTPTATPPTNVSIPDGNAQSLSKKILENSNIVLLPNIPNRNELSSGPKQNIQDTADGKPAWRSTWGDKGHTQQALSAKMLAGMLAIANQNVKIQVNAIVGGDHAEDSRHYYGIAFDIQSAPSETARTKQILGICQAAGATELLGPCNNNTSTKLCKATGYPTNADHQTHIHCGWPRSDINRSDTPSSTTVSGDIAGSCGLPTSKAADMCEGVTANCKKYAARIDELVKDPARARFMKLNMVEESRCKFDATSPATDTGYAYGLFQQQPATAKANVSGCGISESTITPSWLKDEKNLDKVICIQENLIKKLEAKCGTSTRNLAAGQHGIKWCEPSDFCKTEKSCVPGNTYVMKWECPWNNAEHTELDSLAPARESSKQMQYCSEHPGSWMK